MSCGHHALPVDLNDAMSHADTTSLRDAPSHEAADLSRQGQVRTSPGHTSETGGEELTLQEEESP